MSNEIEIATGKGFEDSLNFGSMEFIPELVKLKAIEEVDAEHSYNRALTRHAKFDTIEQALKYITSMCPKGLTIKPAKHMYPEAHNEYFNVTKAFSFKIANTEFWVKSEIGFVDDKIYVNRNLPRKFSRYMRVLNRMIKLKFGNIYADIDEDQSGNDSEGGELPQFRVVDREREGYFKDYPVMGTEQYTIIYENKPEVK